MWIVKVGTHWVGHHGVLVLKKEEAHKWHYKREAAEESVAWKMNSYNDVEVQRA